MYADDGKKYLSDVINEEGVRLLITIIPSKYKKETSDWIKGMLDPIDEQSKRKAYQLYKTELISSDEIGTTVCLQKIHAYHWQRIAYTIIRKSTEDGIFPNRHFWGAKLLSETWF